MYDYLIVGAGLFGATFAYKATKAGKKCLVIDKRTHIGGNCYTSKQAGIHVHEYGAHIFRTSSKYVWNFLSQFCEFSAFVNTPMAVFKGKVKLLMSELKESDAAVLGASALGWEAKAAADINKKK